MLVVDGWVAESCWLSRDIAGAERGLCFVLGGGLIVESLVAHLWGFNYTGDCEVVCDRSGLNLVRGRNFKGSLVGTSSPQTDVQCCRNPVWPELGGKRELQRFLGGDILPTNGCSVLLKQ